MNQREKDIHFIEQRLREELSPEQLMQFERRLAQDFDFASLFEEIKLLRQASRHNHLADKLNQLKNIEEKSSSTPQEINDNDLELINKQLLKKISNDDQKLFDQKIKDENFKTTYQQIQRFQQGIIYSKKQQLKSKVNAWEEGAPALKKINQAKRINIQRLSKWAAAILLLIAITFSIWPKNEPGPNQIFADYFSPYPTTNTVRSGDPILDSLRTKAYTLYENRQFSNAIPILEELSLQRDTIAQFYLANSYLAQGTPTPAIRILENIHHQDNSLSNPSKWFLALGYLDIKNIPKASEYLKELVNSKSSYSTKAKAILDQLK